DAFTVILEGQGKPPQLVYKHSIVSVAPQRHSALLLGVPPGGEEAAAPAEEQTAGGPAGPAPPPPAPPTPETTETPGGGSSPRCTASATTLSSSTVSRSVWTRPCFRT